MARSSVRLKPVPASAKDLAPIGSSDAEEARVNLTILITREERNKLKKIALDRDITLHSLIKSAVQTILDGNP